MIQTLTGYDINYPKAHDATMALIAMFPNKQQISLTHRPQCTPPEEKLTDGEGSLFDRSTKSIIKEESDFTVFNEAFKDSYLYDIYKMFENVGRFRIMTCLPKRCYSIHKDRTKRYHYPITTSKGNHFLFPEATPVLYSLQVNKLYKIDTTHRHTFLNTSDAPRVHLVLDDISSVLPLNNIRSLDK